MGIFSGVDEVFGKKGRNSIIAGLVGSVVLGPVGAAAAVWAAHATTKEDEYDNYEDQEMNPNIVEFSVWSDNGRKLEGVVDKENIRNILQKLKYELSAGALEEILIGCRWGTGDDSDKAQYMKFDHAYHLYGRG